MRLTQFKQLIGITVIISLVALSIASQLKYTVFPFLKSYKHIPYMLAQDDLGQLKVLAYPVYQLVDEINKYPQEANFYFAPSFVESQSLGLWRWYIFVLSRYLCYPRKVFCMAGVVYHNSKSEYVDKFIQGKLYFSQLDWIKEKNISYVVIFREGGVSILPVSAEIGPQE
ncbi:MAG: hypothetical protein WC628_00830 [Candidatus Omnitrophota bacterium]